MVNEVGEFDEKVFLRNFKTNPELAFRQLMNEYRDRVFLFCRKASKDNMGAEDLAQEVFIRTWKGLAKFRGDSSLTTWIYRIAWNVCATHLDQKGKKPLMASYAENSDDETGTYDVHLGEDDYQVTNFEDRQFLEVLFERLPASQKMVLTLYYLQGQTYDEIASIADLPLGTVKATLHRAKAKLRVEAEAELGNADRY